MTTRYNAKPTIVAFLDIKSAYDSVDRQLLWECCMDAKIPGSVVRMLSGMFDHNRSRVVVEGSKGKWFKNKVGLMQGSSLSPLLYALFIDDLPKMLLRNGFPSVPLGTPQSIQSFTQMTLHSWQSLWRTCNSCLITALYLLKRGISSGVLRNARYSSPTSPSHLPL